MNINKYKEKLLKEKEKLKMGIYKIRKLMYYTNIFFIKFVNQTESFDWL